MLVDMPRIFNHIRSNTPFCTWICCSTSSCVKCNILLILYNTNVYIKIYLTETKYILYWYMFCIRKSVS